MKISAWALLFLFLPLLPGRYGAVLAQGSLIVTGRSIDAIHFANPEKTAPEQFITAALDFLAFGKKAAIGQVAERSAVRIAYLSERPRTTLSTMGPLPSPNPFRFVSGYTDPSIFYLDESGWQKALVPGAFDVVFIGSPATIYTGYQPQFLSNLLADKSLLQTFFNQGGKLFVMVQQTYGFLPKFGASDQDAGTDFAGTKRNITRVTQEGYGIGLSDGMIDEYIEDLFRNVDMKTFKVFERANERAPAAQRDLPATLGFRGLIKDSIFVPDTTVYTVQRPQSTVPSASFADSLCVEFFSPTDGATLAYALHGAGPASPLLALPNHGRLCFRQTTTIRLIGKKIGWLNSPDTAFTYTLKPPRIDPPQTTPQVAKPSADKPSGTIFSDSLCVAFSTSTPGAFLNYALDGSIPDSAGAPLSPPGTLCFRQTTTISLQGRKPAWAKSDTALYTYTLKAPLLPSSLALFAAGEEIDAVTADRSTLEVRLTRGAGVPCAGCTVQAALSGSADKEIVPLTARGTFFGGTFIRIESLAPVPGDGTLQHLVSDSIVLVWTNPAEAGDTVRRSYPYVHLSETVDIRPQNTVAKTTFDRTFPDGRQWLISDAPGLVVRQSANDGSCCRISAMPVDSRNPDSIGMVGIVVEASRGFTLDLKVFSNLGEFVNRVRFAVPESEFAKLGAVPGKDTRFLRLLWNGLARDGTQAGNGAYVFRTSIALLPVPGPAAAPAPANSTRRVGILRGRD